MKARIETLDRELQVLFEKIDFSVLHTSERLNSGLLNHIMLEFTQPANQLIAEALTQDSSEEFNREISKLIQKYRTAIAVKYTSETALATA